MVEILKKVEILKNVEIIKFMLIVVFLEKKKITQVVSPDWFSWHDWY